MNKITNSNFKFKTQIFFIFLAVVFMLFALLPKKVLAEIATARDWIGFFAVGAGDTKNATVNSNSWKYASNCLQTTPIPGTSPKLQDSPGCTFTISPAPPLGSYELRLYANDGQTADALIAKSNPLSLAPTPIPGTDFCPGGDKGIRISSGFLLTTKEFFDANPLYAASNFCLLGDRALISSIYIPSGYEEMKVTYYDKSKLSKTPITGNATEANLNLSAEADSEKLYSITGNLTLGNPIAVLSGAVTVIFVDGNLYINDDQTHIFDNSGLVFVVSGDVNIAPNVTEVDAIIITFGTFCSILPSGYTNCPTDLINSLPLTIKGSIISLNTELSPKFVRSLTDNTGPAENIIYQPKYLIILKNIFSKTLTIWKEIQ